MAMLCYGQQWVSTFKNVAVLTALIIKSVDTEVYGIELNKGLGSLKMSQRLLVLLCQNYWSSINLLIRYKWSHIRGTCQCGTVRVKLRR